MLLCIVSFDNSVIQARAVAVPAAQPVAERRAVGAGGLIPALAGVVMFSFTGPMTKIVVRGSSVLFAAAGRAVLAGIIAGALLFAYRVTAPRGRARRHILVAAPFVFAFPLLLAWAFQTVPSTHGAVVIALLPLATGGAAAIVAGERPSTGYWACSAVGLAAVAGFVASEGGARVEVGDLLLVLAVVAAAIGYTYGGLASATVPGWQVISWIVVWSLPVMVPLTLIGLAGSGMPDTTGQWWAFVYSGVASNLIGFFAWYRGLATAGIARASQVQLLQPMMSLLWAWPLVGEPVTAVAIGASVVVVAAVALGRRTAISRTLPRQT